ncbi:MAG: hypothetical protein ACKPE3_30200, partial [Sphaerospermopsis kisseleviana]
MDTLEVLDAEVIELERKRWRDGGLAQRDKNRLYELNALKKQEFDKYQQSQTIESALEQVSNPDNYESTLLDNNKAHILQYQMGQIVLEKKCPNCGRPMFLQHEKRPDGSPLILSNFFWSCTGFYENNPAILCKTTISFNTKDIGLLPEVLNVKILRILSKLCIDIGDTKFEQLMTLFSIDNGFYLGKTQ